MCGIAGVWGEANRSLVTQMMGAMGHRGPDAQGQLVWPNGALGHRRLSIVDPEGGDQPILNEDATKAIVANGEVYNFPALSRELGERHRFRSRSDTEAVLHLYEMWGPRSVTKLDGMFAVAIADGPVLFAARDPVGVKPLYYARHNGRFVFASEIKALCGAASAVREFPPGAWFRSDMGFRSYYRVPDRQPRNMPLDVRTRLLRATLEQAVCKRLMGDVPVGTFLSGGLDSSIIAAIGRHHLKELHSFSVGLAGCADIEAARLTARHLGTVHHEYIYTAEEVLHKLPEIIYYLESFDVDLVRSAIPCYFASRLASEHVKVTLTGEGADELFAGYQYHRSLCDSQVLHDELRRSISALHNMNLQRVDRLTMAHSVEGRVPFLDAGVINVAQSIPPEMKLRGDPPVEKWILRWACEDLLPVEIAWRTKEQFDEGSGTTAVLGKVAARMAKRLGVVADGAATARDLEARVYRCLYRREYPPATDKLVARWRGSPGSGCADDWAE